MLSYLTTFIAVFVVDIIYTYYLKAVAENSGIKAGFWGAVCWLIGSIAGIEYTSDHWVLITACIGAFLGTWVGIKIRNKK